MEIIVGTLATLVMLAPYFLILIFILLGIKVMIRYLKTNPIIREERKIMQRSLAESLKENRIKNNMTQEFVAETIGVSRQAVSKWESGKSDPSTSNLYVLAKLYKISAEELLNNAIDNIEVKK
ncbi:helix-turn-helix transcriptional regulator [Macrococcus armenti]|uniref:helix-turn-helix transcriptional regulator n=1 Tax=Macrococcus armenti TaxID=2875764 RepID=UPI001CCE5CBA|nr:helix-turn-helix transcriptional regulator [Macrococcus armenti]UBH08867.1 helix-turn-helix domain-containing protein [Macrococcus armenti]UBH11165.1 helix-turn-helix domain-containing protein [Macrococcus armenti]